MRDDLCRIIRDYFQSFGKRYRIIRRTKFLEVIWYMLLRLHVLLILYIRNIMATHCNPVVGDSSSPPLADGWRVVKVRSPSRDTMNKHSTCSQKKLITESLTFEPVVTQWLKRHPAPFQETKLTQNKLWKETYTCRRSGRACFWEELAATSKLYSSTHFQIKGNCSPEQGEQSFYT